MHQLFVNFKKACDSVRRERKVLYNISTEFCTPMKLVRLIKMCLNEAIYIDKYLSDALLYRIV